MQQQENTNKPKRVSVTGKGNTFERSTLIFQSPSRWASVELKGTMVVGTYLGTKIDQEGNANFLFEALEDGVYINGDGTKQSFVTGDRVIVNTTGSLKAKMNHIAIGTTVEIVYNGKYEIKEGKMKGKFAHGLDVLVDEGTKLINDEDISA